MRGAAGRLIVCSNSGPAATVDGASPPAAGGLVPHILELLAAAGGDWVHRGDGPPSVRTWPGGRRAHLHPLPPRPTDHGHYEIVSIQLLSWLFHYLHDTVTTPDIDRGLLRAWSDYQDVNAEFVRKVNTLAIADDSVVLVNDYHLMLVPGLLRATGAHRPGRVVYAHHVPWCEPAYFDILPAHLRTEILTSLLQADVVSFHCRRWKDAFARCCTEFLPARVDQDMVELSGRGTRLVSVPFPLDVAAVDRLADTPAWQQQTEWLDRARRGRRLLARVDRLDLWKNHPRGFRAYAELLSHRPDLADLCCFVAIAAPTRFRSRRHDDYLQRCRETIADLNCRYGEGTVHLLISTGADSRARALATLAAADAVLINPTYDGFNVVAKEALLTSSTSRVLLSTTAGAHEYLAPAVTSIEAFDLVGTAEALESALSATSPVTEPPAGNPVRSLVREDRTADWMGSILGERRAHR